ncbi:hypothetical protein ALC62_01283 [Cyphomyrmex costatus]|uniref:Uncharacterized protein n=1 Tax=Cyphomyrmex costatus TaxID=456900 RepID=A0A195D4G7_9HYME|nr:hypothetical protein ALC62_01283 [Cyphomyrmex costatus]
MQRLAPSLMPATRYVSKQLADWSVLDQDETADRRGSRRKRPCKRNPRKSASARSNRDIPFALLTKRSHSRVLSASLLWHKQHTMPEPAFALFYIFFFFFHSFVTLPPCLVGRCTILGLEKLLFLPFYIVQYPSKSRDTTFDVNTTLSFRFFFSHSRNYSFPFSPSLSLNSVTPLHNSLLPTHTNPFPTSLYDQLRYISKI